MAGKVLAVILRPLGFYEVNEDYMKAVNEKLEEIEADLSSVATVSNSSSQVIDALKSGETTKAVEVGLEFCKIDDEVKELKEIKRKLEAEEGTIATAVAAANGPALIEEIVESTKKEFTGHCDKVTDLLIDIAALVKEVGAKLTNLPSASKTWSWAERLGTPKELRNTGKKVEEVQASAEKAKKDLDALTKSINQLGATP